MTDLLEQGERLLAARKAHEEALEACRIAQETARKTGAELFKADRKWKLATPEIVASLRARSI